MSCIENRCYNCSKAFSPKRTCYSNGECPKFEPDYKPGKETKAVYHNGMITVRKLTEEEKAEYGQLKPGIYQTGELARSVAIENGEMRIIECSADGISQIWFNL